MANDNDGGGGKAINDYNAERQYLEQLLGARVNLYLVFVSFYFVAVFGAEPDTMPGHMRALAFALGGVISLFMSLSVLRTTILVEHVLRAFRSKYAQHPYSKAYSAFDGIPLLKVSANWYTAALPLIVTFAFAWLSWQTW
jgi:hypothetical protein